MIALFLLACDPGSALPDTVDTADTAAPASTVGACLADGGSLVERAASTPWTAGLKDLEVASDGTLYALGWDGHLLMADPTDLAGTLDLGAVGGAGEQLDATGDTLLVDAGGARVGSADLSLSDWVLAANAWGDSAVSPDGSQVAFSYTGCGVDWGLVNVADGAALSLDPAATDDLPLGFEYLDDGRLAATTINAGGTAALLVFDDLLLEQRFDFAGGAPFPGRMETLDDSVVLSTAGDGKNATIERVYLDDGSQTSVDLPFTFVNAVAVDPTLSWALGAFDTTLIAADGATSYNLGSWPEVEDIVADPEGMWVAMSSRDGVLRVYGCE